MEVILLESFDRLGQIGDIVNVKNGFARNFLIPQKKALRANKENKDKFLKIKNDLLEKNKKIVEESKLILKKLRIRILYSSETQVTTDNSMDPFHRKTSPIILMKKKLASNLQILTYILL